MCWLKKIRRSRAAVRRGENIIARAELDAHRCAVLHDARDAGGFAKACPLSVTWAGVAPGSQTVACVLAGTRTRSWNFSPAISHAKRLRHTACRAGARRVSPPPAADG